MADLGLSALAAAALAGCRQGGVVLALFVVAVAAHWAMWLWLYISVLRPSTVWGLVKAVALGTAVAALLIMTGLVVIMLVFFDLE